MKCTCEGSWSVVQGTRRPAQRRTRTISMVLAGEVSLAGSAQPMQLASSGRGASRRFRDGADGDAARKPVRKNAACSSGDRLKRARAREHSLKLTGADRIAHGLGCDFLVAKRTIRCVGLRQQVLFGCAVRSHGEGAGLGRRGHRPQGNCEGQQQHLKKTSEGFSDREHLRKDGLADAKGQDREGASACCERARRAPAEAQSPGEQIPAELSPGDGAIAGQGWITGSGMRTVGKTLRHSPKLRATSSTGERLT